MTDALYGLIAGILMSGVVRISLGRLILREEGHWTFRFCRFDEADQAIVDRVNEAIEIGRRSAARVKPLVWEQFLTDGSQQAQDASEFAWYTYYTKSRMLYRGPSDDETIGRFEAFEEAKRVAEADYEIRIRATILSKQGKETAE